MLKSDARLFRRAVRRLGRGGFYARVRAAHWLGGIEAVARLLPHAPPGLVTRILRRYGAEVGEQVTFKDGLQIDNAGTDRDSTGDFSHLVIGDRCYIGKGVLFDLPDRITLGEEVVLSAGCKLFTHADCGNRVMSRWYPRQRAPVRLGRGSWLGAGSVVLAGVELGPCCVVGAGAVVTDSFPERSVVAGVPARRVRTLEATSSRLVRSAAADDTDGEDIDA